MREIKFRAWFEDGTDSKMRNFDLWEAASELWALDPPIMQYTGLKDKNGKEIYEGDIVAYKRKMDSSFEILQIVYNQKVAGFTVGRGEDDFGAHSLLGNYYVGTTEVIGNIYENPELLK